ncbi:MAG: acetylserotonin O-methyltransferase [Desulfarculus sp.]|nr:acetylserotonin O-methyltransferase [Desulfarculus sp.]
MNNQTTPWGPERLRAVASAYWESCTLHAAVRCGLTEALAAGPASPAELAERLGLSPRGLAILVRALLVLDLVREQDGQLSLNPGVVEHFTPGGPRDLSSVILHMADMVGDWAQLAECVRRGQPVERPALDQTGPAPRAHFYRAMRDIARRQAPGMAGRLGLKPGQILLDLGGGPGVYGLTFADEVPGLSAIVFDLPQAREHFQAEAALHPGAERVRFREGDFLRDDLGGPYDVAWLSQILHGEGPEECERLVRAAAEALKPGGWLWVQEFVVQIPGLAWPGLFGLNMLINTRRGQSYTAAEIKAMLVKAGLTQVRYDGPVRADPAAGLVCGQKPDGGTA